MRDVPLGTLIFRAGLLAEEQLEDALQEGMRTGKRLGEVLAERGLIKDTDLGRLLAGQQGLPYVEAATLAVDPAAMARLPENIARMQNALAFAVEDGLPVVAVADPTNELVVENVRRALGVEPRLVVAAHGELARKIQESYAQPVQPAVEPAPAPAPEVAPVAPVEAPVAVEQPSAPVAPAPEPAAAAEAAPPAPPAVAPMPTTVPPAEERAAEPAVAVQPLVTAPVATEVPPLHAQAAAEPPLAPEPTVPQPAAAPAPEAAPEVAPAEPVAPAPAAPPPAEQLPAEPVVVVAETPATPPAPEQPVEPGLFAQAAEQVLAPPAAPEPPPVAQEPVPTPAPVEPTHLVVLRLTGEDRVEIGAFGGQDDAESFARTVVGRISRAEEQSEWPLFGDRFIRPQTIVSVDVVERSAASWTGSQMRARWDSPPA